MTKTAKFSVKTKGRSQAKPGENLGVTFMGKRDGIVITAIRDLAFAANVSTTEVVRQMVLHCLGGE